MANTSKSSNYHNQEWRYDSCRWLVWICSENTLYLRCLLCALLGRGDWIWQPLSLVLSSFLYGNDLAPSSQRYPEVQSKIWGELDRVWEACSLLVYAGMFYSLADCSKSRYWYEKLVCYLVSTAGVGSTIGHYARLVIEHERGKRDRNCIECCRKHGVGWMRVCC
jgi:hypothetical protein